MKKNNIDKIIRDMCGLPCCYYLIPNNMEPRKTKQCIKCQVYTPIELLDKDGYCDECKPFIQDQNLKEEANQNII